MEIGNILIMLRINKHPWKQAHKKIAPTEGKMNGSCRLKRGFYGLVRKCSKKIYRTLNYQEPVRLDDILEVTNETKKITETNCSR